MALEGAGPSRGCHARTRGAGRSPRADVAAGLRAVLCAGRGEAREGAAASRDGGLPALGPRKSGRTGRGRERRRRRCPKTNPGSRSRRLRPTSPAPDPALPRPGMLAGPGPPRPARLPAAGAGQGHGPWAGAGALRPPSGRRGTRARTGAQSGTSPPGRDTERGLSVRRGHGAGH